MSLPSPGEPLKLANGMLVYPNGEVTDPSEMQPSFVEIPTNREAVSLVVAARKKITDLPDVPKTMNTISVVLSYSLFGLDDFEIAVATGMTAAQIGRIKMHDAYAQMHDSVVQSIIAAETNDVREMFQRHSRTAVDRLVHVLHHSKSEQNKISVARDILDRAGHRPVDIVEHRHKLDGGLTIEVIRRDDKIIPTIDISVED